MHIRGADRNITQLKIPARGLLRSREAIPVFLSQALTSNLLERGPAASRDFAVEICDARGELLP
ncbi:hypothetical protein ACE103_14455 [Bradyrhizobium sp. ma5]|uniref:hypothetical protein n=1 Tax=Bradyrhizobium sp. ma5 TaxID=3344828 RepID=UPI0035D459DF